MRKIEMETIVAVKAKRNWQAANMLVSFNAESDLEGVSTIYLHGNRIATYNHADGVYFADKATLARWPTNTTKGRLRAFGLNVTTKRGVTYLNGVAV